MPARTPPRLTWLHSSTPLYFVTTCMMDRRHLLANDRIHSAFLGYGEKAIEYRIAVGRYVIMPDHIHLFVRVTGDRRLSPWVGGLKRHLTTAGGLSPGSWQRGFFDHVLRSGESYAQKWEYVWQNPVRAGLVADPKSWLFAGEIAAIDRA